MGPPKALRALSAPTIQPLDYLWIINHMGYGDNKYKNIWNSELPEMQYAKNALQDPSSRAEVKAKFKERKWLYRFITLFLFFAVTLIIYASTTPDNRNWFIPFMVVTFFGLYHLAGVIILRCPACNFGLSFTKTRVIPISGDFMIPTGGKENDRSSKLSCPHCRNQLS